MSLLGKILAFLNILGAIGLLCLAATDYAKRRAWAYSLFRHDLVINGLPLDQDQRDIQGRPLAEQISAEVANDLFAPVGGDPVATQVDEVQRVKNLLTARIATATTPGEKLRIEADILLPLAGNQVEREQLLVSRKEFASKAAEDAFRARLLAAYLAALSPPRAEGKEAEKDWFRTLPATFEVRFRQALRDDAGGPAEPFVGEIARQTLETQGFFDKPETLADAREMTTRFDGFFKQAVEAQAALLDTRFNDAFEDALYGPKAFTPSSTGPRTLTEARRLAVARLLFALAPQLARDAVLAGRGAPTDAALLQGQVDGSAGYQDRVLQTEAYRRAFNRLLLVVGLEPVPTAITEQALVLQQMSADLSRAMTDERLSFVAAHGALLSLVQERAYLVESELALLDREDKNLAEMKGVVERRKVDLKKYQDQLTELQAATAAEVKKLQVMSQKLYDLRVLLRDTRVKNIQGEQQIRELETKIRELETR